MHVVSGLPPFFFFIGICNSESKTSRFLSFSESWFVETGVSAWLVLATPSNESLTLCGVHVISSAVPSAMEQELNCWVRAHDSSWASFCGSLLKHVLNGGLDSKQLNYLALTNANFALPLWLNFSCGNETGRKIELHVHNVT